MSWWVNDGTKMLDHKTASWAAEQYGRYAYISDRQRGTEELYDHREDPMEWTNLAGSPEHAGTKARRKALVPRADEPKSPENPD